MQNALNKCAKALAEVADVPTASAYCQARRKLQPELFVHLNEVVAQRYTELSRGDGSLRLWQGRRVLGVDGSYLNLPDTARVQRADQPARRRRTGAGAVQCPL